MRISLVTRAGRACFAAMLAFSLSPGPSFARMGGSAGGSFAHPVFGMGHASHFMPHGFNRRSDAGRFGFNRFGPKHFDRFSARNFNRFGFNRFGGSQLFVGGWGGWGGFPVSTPVSEPVIIDDSAPVIINIGLDPGPGGTAGAVAGGCVIHKLNYDANGKYVGERQIPLC
jgi:hypothetical protein